MRPVVHTLRFADAEHHYVEVETLVPGAGRPGVELAMAVWTPGSYLVREYARHVEGITAEAAGKPVKIEKVSKNRWRIESTAAAEVRVRYRLYCREMSVRTNFVDASFALLNGAATFLTPPAEPRRPHEVVVVPREGWDQVISALPAVGQGELRFRAEDYDTLVDSPLYAGNAPVYRFDVDGKPHLLVNEGEQYGVWDGSRSAADTERIVRAQRDFWGALPYERYVFFNLVTEGRGGLEHRNSTLLMTSRWNARTAKGYRRWLSLVSHELFHTWNVKRLRPVELGPFDYEEENYTRSLWIAEGITSYYGDLLLRRAGLITREQYLGGLSEAIERLQTTPGRAVQTLLESSFDTWIKQYRPDENSTNSRVSYYNKGQIVAFLLDVEIRRASGGERSLDDVLRRAWELHSEGRGYTHEELVTLVSEVAGKDLSDFLRRGLETTGELDYGPALAWYGLCFGEQRREGREREEDEEPAAWLGAETEIRDGRLTVRAVRRGTPAWEAGVDAEDEILALGDFRVPPQGLGERLEAYRPGEEVSLLLARRERLVRLSVVLGEEPERPWKLEADPGAGEESTRRLERWIGP